MSIMSGTRFGRHVRLVLTCLLGSVVGQLGLIGWYCLVSPTPSCPGRLSGVLEPGFDAPINSPTWTFYLALSGRYIGTDGYWEVEDPANITLHPAWGRWCVIRQASAKAVSSNQGPTIKVPISVVPWWVSGNPASPPTDEDVDRFTIRFDVAFGWPFPAMGLASEALYQPVEIRMFDAIRVWPETPLARSPTQSLGFFPTRVLWPGMLANVVIGAAVLAALAVALTVIRVFRARRRQRRGLCGSCGYGPWSGAVVCPECGATQPQGHAPIMIN